MTLPRTRILRVVEPENGGPRALSILAGLAEHHGEANGKRLITSMVRAGDLVIIGVRKGARYGLPRRRA